MNNLLIGKQDLANNPTRRLPVCVCLDVSESMAGDPIQELNRGLQLFFNAIKDDPIAQWSAEICVVTFGGHARNEVDFASIHRQEIPYLRPYGGTPMGEAVNLGLDLLDRRKDEYSKAGIDYFQPWLILMTDGYPNGDIGQLNRAMERTNNLISNRKLTLFPIGIGQGADLNTLRRFSGNRGAFTLNDMQFSEFFQWLSQSVSETSISSPGNEVDLFEAAKTMTSQWNSHEVAR